nr:hypothetical protein [uncultured Holophaga sp.]
MALRYFGTDGVRGEALKAPLTLEDTVRWGAAWGQVARARGIAELILGWDPRCSSTALAEAFVQGLAGQVRTLVLGMVPTPAVAWVTARRPLSWGLMISASHNPPQDNGIKGFNHQGEKLSEEDEEAVERAFEATPVTPFLGAALTADASPVQEYLAHLGPLTLPPDFRLVVDCAHGATAPFAPALLQGPGLSWIGIPADGERINVGVGSTHLDGLRHRVLAEGAALGIAFDGDGDRCLMVDGQGDLVDGDQLLWLLVQDQVARGRAVPGVVGTLMSNGGLESALRHAGIPFTRTPVGDKFMLRELAQCGWDLAAEASGHLIQKHLGPSGDGLATALAALHALLARPEGERWSWRFEPWPLKLVNLTARDRRPVEQCPLLLKAMKRMETDFGDTLRVVVRWSGTEPKLRLMVEARETRLMEDTLDRLEEAARADLGI